MYAMTYKRNNSYITYVIRNREEDSVKSFQYKKSVKPLEWKCGARVKHYFHGKGKICDISNNQIIVSFGNSRVFGSPKAITVTYEFKTKPSEIDSLHLFYQ